MYQMYRKSSLCLWSMVCLLIIALKSDNNFHSRLGKCVCITTTLLFVELVIYKFQSAGYKYENGHGILARNQDKGYVYKLV